MLYIPQASDDVRTLLQAQDAMEMQLSSITQCKTFLTNALELLASLLRETPAMCSALMPADVIHATVDLMAHGGFTVGNAIHNMQPPCGLLAFQICWIAPSFDSKYKVSQLLSQHRPCAQR